MNYIIRKRKKNDKKIKYKIIILIIILLISVIGTLKCLIKQNNDKIENKIKVSTINKIDNLDDVYNNETLSNYTDIRELDKDYNIEDAQKDNCFIIGAMVHNDYLYSDFMNNYYFKKSSFIRVVQSTNEGDIYIIDLLYDKKSDKIYMIKDDTRDEFSSLKDRTIKFKKYDKIGTLKNDSHEYWILYNGDITNITNDESNNLFVIATIN